MPQKTVINETSLAALLGITPQPFIIIVGKPDKDSKSMRVKKFAKRVQRAK